MTEAVNKRVPIIASSAGGIPLQVKHGENGWVVPTGDSKAVSSLFYDIYTGKKQVHRYLSRSAQSLDGKSDLNSEAEAFVRDFDKPMIRVHSDNGATSEDFWTVGNATRWMLLADRLLGLPVSGGELNAQESGLLSGMEVGQKLGGVGVDGKNVWEMVMGKNMISGEGEIRWEGS